MLLILNSLLRIGERLLSDENVCKIYTTEQRTMMMMKRRGGGDNHHLKKKRIKEEANEEA